MLRVGAAEEQPHATARHLLWDAAMHLSTWHPQKACRDQPHGTAGGRGREVASLQSTGQAELRAENPAAAALPAHTEAPSRQESTSTARVSKTALGEGGAAFL